MLKLYSYRRCPFAIRARMTLHEKNIPFEIIEENLRELSDELKRYHPEGRVPLLLDEDKPIYESCIITEYLDDKYPEPALMPKNAFERMQVREWTYWCNQEFKPAIDAYKYGVSRSTPEEVAASQDKLTSHLQRIENALSGRDWLVGSLFSLADIHVFPFFRQLERVPQRHPQIDKSVQLLDWFDRICSRPSYIRAMSKEASSA